MSMGKQACQVREVSVNALPLSCPADDERVWDAHPKVYLAIEKTGEVICPYCGIHYQLKR